MHDGLQRANWDALDQALVDRAGRNVARGTDAALRAHGPEPPIVDGSTWSNTAASTGPPTSRSGVQTSSTRDASVGSRSSAGEAARSASGKSTHSHVHTQTGGAGPPRSSFVGDPPHQSLSSGTSLRSFPSGGFGMGLPPAGYISLADPPAVHPGFPPPGPGSVFSHAHGHLMPDAPAAGLAAYGNVLPLTGSMGGAYAEAGLDPLASDTRSIRSLGGLSAAIRRHESLVDAATVVGYPSAPASDRVNTHGVGASAMLVSEDAGSYSHFRTPMMGAGWQGGATLSVADTAPLSQRSALSAPQHALKASEVQAQPAPVEVQQATANANRMAFELVSARTGAVFAEPSSARDARPWDDAGSANTWPVPALTVPPIMQYGAPGMTSARKEPWITASARGYGGSNLAWTSQLTSNMPSPGYFGMMPAGGGMHAYGQTQTPGAFLTPTSEGLGHMMGHPHGPFAWANERAPMARPGYWAPSLHDAPYQQGPTVPPLNTSALEYGYAMGASARSYEDPAAAMASAHAAGLTFAMNASSNPTSRMLPVTYVADADLRAIMGRMQPHSSAPGRAAASAPARPRQTTAAARGGAAAPAKGGSARSKQSITGRRGPGRPKGSRTKTSPSTTAAAIPAPAPGAAASTSAAIWGGGDDGDDAGGQPPAGWRTGQIDRKRARTAGDPAVDSHHARHSTAPPDGHIRDATRTLARPTAAQAAAALTSDALAALAHSSNKRARILSEASRSASLGGSRARGMRARKAWVGVSYVARIRKYRSYYFHPFLKKTIGCGSFSSAYEAAKARHRVICELTPETRTHITQDFVPDEDDEDAADLLPADASAGVLAHGLAPDTVGPSDGSGHAPIDGGDPAVNAASVSATNVDESSALEQHGDASPVERTCAPQQDQREDANEARAGNSTSLVEASPASSASQSSSLTQANPDGVTSAPVALAAIADAESAAVDDISAPT